MVKSPRVKYQRNGKFCSQRRWTPSFKGFSAFLILAVSPLWLPSGDGAGCPVSSSTSQAHSSASPTPRASLPACLRAFSGSEACRADLGPVPRPQVTSREWRWLRPSSWFFSGRARCCCRSEGGQGRGGEESP